MKKLYFLGWLGIFFLTLPALAQTPPADPTGLTVVRSTAVAVGTRLTWTDNATDETRYEIERGDFEAGPFTKIADAAVDATSYEDNPLTAGNTYCYRVRAVKVLRTGDLASGYTGPTCLTLDPPSPPNAPTNLQGSESFGNITITWQDNSSDETNFVVEYGTSSGGPFPSSVTRSANVTTYTKFTNPPGSTFCFRVKATNRNGDSRYTDVVCVTVPLPAPGQPTGLVANATSESQIQLSWNSGGNTTNYEIERSPDGSTGWINIATVAHNAGSISQQYTNTGLAPSTTYHYRVRGLNSNSPPQASAFSSTANATTQSPPPPANPSGLGATAAGTSQINLAWTDNAGDETGYEVERSPNGSDSWANIATLAANATSYSNTGLSAGTRYYYRVRAVKTGATASGFSNVADATTQALNLPPPTNVAATAASSSQIGLTWTLPSSTDATGYELERQNGPNPFAKIADLGTGATNYTDNGLASNTAYTYRLRAVGPGSTTGPYSDTSVATTQAAPPAAPGNMVATVNSPTSVGLTWQDNSGDETGFLVQRSVSGGAFADLITVGANTTSHTDNTASPGTQYQYRVQAVKTGASSSGFATSNSVTTPGTPPAAPSALSVTGTTATSVGLSWTDNSADETGFELWRGAASGSLSLLTTLAANATAFTDNGVSASSTYYYQVRAVKSGASASGFSNEVSATTPAPPPTPPAAPSNVAASAVSSSQINLTWQDNSGDETGVEVERSPNGTDSWSNIATLAANATSFSNTALLASTTYHYRVRAVKTGAASSAYAGPASATTPAAPVPPPADPGNVVATANAFNQVGLTWQDNSADETGFLVQRSVSGGAFVDVATLAANVATYTDNSVSVSTQYQYRVQALKTGAPSSGFALSNSVTTPAAPPTAPRPPTDFTATANGQNAITLSWTNPASGTFTGLELDWSPNGTDTWTALSVGGSATSFSHTGLSAGTTYHYRLRAVNTVSGASATSSYATASATTDAPPPTPPAAPTNLTAPTVAASAVTLTWQDNANDETGFEVERRLASSADFVKIADVGAATTTAPTTASYVDGSVGAGTAYVYRVRAVRTGRATVASGYSNELAVTTPGIPPADPSRLVATANAHNQVGLAWSDNSGDETGFEVQRSSDGGATFPITFNAAANATSFTDNSVAASTTYQYRLRALKTGAPSSGFTLSNSVTTPAAPVPPPGAPSGLTASATSPSQINLNWTDNAGDETGFEVERSPNGTDSWSNITTTAANATSYSNTGLAAATRYYYRVRAVKTGASASGYSNVADATTQAAPIPPPADPSNVVATASAFNQVGLTWADNSSDETGFLVQRSVSGGAFADVATLAANVTSYTDNSVSASTQYQYRVQAVKTGASSSGFATSNSVTTPTAPPTTPNPPTNFVATAAGQSQINLSWTTPTGTFTGLELDWSPNGTDTWTSLAVAANATSFNHTGLSADTRYFYRLRSANTVGGITAYSAYVTADARTASPPSAPAAPSGLTVSSPTSTQVNLGWTDNSGDETGFEIFRETVGGAAATLLTTLGADVTSYADNSVAGGTTYRYTVRAIKTGAPASGFSNTADVSVLLSAPAGPSGLAATPNASGQPPRVVLTWTDNSADETGFTIQRSSDAGATYPDVFTVGANVATYTDNGVAANTTYRYRVFATRTGGYNSGFSNTADATTPPAVTPPPADPSTLRVSATTTSSITLLWQDNANDETGFELERSADVSPRVWSKIADVGAATPTAPTTVSYVDGGRDAATSYVYRVRAVKAGASPSGYSNEVVGRTGDPPPTAPPTPTLSGTLQPDNTTARLTWNNVASDATYELQRSLDNVAFTALTAPSAGVTSHDEAGLSANTTYYYRIRAVRSTAGGTASSPFSNTVTITTPAPPPTAPAAPSNVAASAVSSSQINLTWQDNSGDETGVEVERSPNGTDSWANIATLAANATSFSNTALLASTTYHYRVRAVKTGAASSAYAGPVSATTPAAPVPPPADPSNVVATASAFNQVGLTWQDNSADETGFLVQRSVSGGAFVDVATLAANVATYTDNSVSASTQYQYRVQALKTGAPSSGFALSNSVTTPSAPVPPPGAPSGLTASASGPTSVALSWTDGSTDETGVEVERATGAGAFSLLTTLGANVVSYTDNSVASTTAYRYRVRAIKTGAPASAYSNEASVTTPGNPPADPSRLVATANAHNQVGLAWSDNSGDETGFEVQRSSDGGATFPITFNAAANATSFTDNSVAASTTYQYRLRALKTGAPSSGFTLSNSVTTPAAPPTTPNTPSGLVATAASSSQVNVAWQDNSTNETNVELWRQTGTGASALLATLAANATSYADNSVAPGTTYTYRVRAIIVGGPSSTFSNDATATTPFNPPPVPGGPTGLVATAASPTQINLSFQDGSQDETSFALAVSPDGATFTLLAELPASGGVGTVTYPHTGLTPGQTYYYRVQAVRTENGLSSFSAFSNVAQATTPLPPPPIPGDPSNLAVTDVTQTSVALTYQDGSADETGFLLERAANGGAFAQIAQLPAQPGTGQRSYTDAGLTANTTYQYRIRAVRTEGAQSSFSGYSNVATATTLPLAPPIPGSPATLSASATSPTSIAITFTDGSQDEDGFALERAVGAGDFAPLATLPAQAGAGGSVNYTDGGLTPGTLYRYRVRSVRTANGLSSFSAYSNVASATTPVLPPTAPSALTAMPTSATVVTLTWTDNAGDETGFDLERATGAGDFAKIADVEANITTFQDNTAQPATPYRYRLRAVNGGVASDYSNVATVTTPDVAPTAPTNLTATPTAFDRIVLTWTDVATNETGFVLERSSGGGAFAVVAELGANVTTYLNVGLTANTTYQYRVWARNAVGQSANSNVASATTPNPPGPAAPTNLAAEPIDFERIRLTWNALAPADNVTGMVIQRAINPNGPFTEVGRMNTPGTQFIDIAVLDLATYYYRVAALNALGQSGFSNVAVVLPGAIITATQKEYARPIWTAERQLYVWLGGGRAEESRVTLMNAAGQRATTFPLAVGGATPARHPLDGLPGGVYVVIVETATQRVVQKIWIQ